MVDVKTRFVYNGVSRQTPYYRRSVAEIFEWLSELSEKFWLLLMV